MKNKKEPAGLFLSLVGVINRRVRRNTQMGPAARRKIWIVTSRESHPISTFTYWREKLLLAQTIFLRWHCSNSSTPHTNTRTGIRKQLKGFYNLKKKFTSIKTPYLQMDSYVCDTKHQSITFLWILRAMDGWPIRCGQANRDAGRKIPFIARRPWPSDLIEIFATDLERTKKWIIWTTAMRANQRAVGQDRELGEMKENGSNFKTELNHILRWTRDIKSGRTIKQRRETVAPKRPCPINLERILHKSFSWKYFF